MSVKRACWECDSGFETKRAWGHFCSAKHRSDWNNRRGQRGSELYDLIMEYRFDRSTAHKRKTWSLICTLASRFNDEDKAAGRRSWSSSARMAAVNSRVGR